MEKTKLKQIFTSDYNRISFTDNVLKPIFSRSVKEIILYDADREQETKLTDTEKLSAKKIIKYGEFITHDDRKIELYEITIEDFKQVKIARVGLVVLVKKLVIGMNAAFATFKYEDVKDKNWRFSFISRDSFFEGGQVQNQETNPKRYTYVFGDKDETYHTAITRFNELDIKSQIKLEDIQDAFAVEAMSKEFFDEYREIHYINFVRFLTGEEFQKVGDKLQLVRVQEPSTFLVSVFNGDKKEARDFCKKLLGQIVFLYFIQKKGWLGATNTNYKEGNGDKNFIQNFYKQAGENDAFYSVWLSKLFYDTLNKKRDNDDFIMPNGSIVKIPYLNGGLFEKESEDFDFLTFPKELFTNLFEFFNRFNFTIHENSSEEHTIAVDPEMLGHIFENLLEDNKDKGAFYTPKEIVQYMTQESLIEYLVTHLGEQAREGISKFVKQKDKEALTDKQLNEIDGLLDKVKICDPAIGSGAFPMGLLHEIFTLKEQIVFDLGFKIWSPATVKGNIIQNSIYGVDIEKGAVDIAKLRFWLSLIVDEEEPKPLPNLAYKIVVGNSLVSKFDNEIIEIDWEVKKGTQGDLYKAPYQEKIKELLNQISEKQKKYFTADNTADKLILTRDIRLLKLKILSKQLELMIDTKGFEKISNEKLSKLQIELWLETEGWKRTLKKVNALKKNNKPFNHFDWRLDFPEILNPIVNENTGFDIIIGNPPYIDSESMIKNGEGNLRDILAKKMNYAKGNWDIYIPFYEQGFNLLNPKGNIVYITPDKWISKSFGYELRKGLKSHFYEITEAGRKIFKSAKVDSIITFSSRLLKGIVNINIINDNKIDRLHRFNMNNLNEPYSLDWLFSSHIKEIFEIEKNTNKISDYIICENACATSDAYKLKGFIYNNDKARINENQLKVINTGTIDKYSSRWGKKDMTYLKNKYLYPVVNKNEFLDAFSKSYGAKSILPKIIIKGLTFLDGSIDEKGVIIPGKTTLVLPSKDVYLIKWISAIINSKVPIFYIKEKYRGSSYNQGINFTKNMINELPIPFVTDKFKENTVKLIDYILFFNPQLNNNSISDNLIINYFEQIIDGIVYELYFPELLKKHKRTIIEHLGDLPELTTDNEKEIIINKVFKCLYDKNHPVKNNLFHMRNIKEIATIEAL